MAEGPTLADVRALSRALERLYGAGDVAAFAANVLAALPEVVGSEMTSVCVMDRRRGTSINRVRPAEHMTAENNAAWLRHLREHPGVEYTDRTRDGRTKLMSDFWSQRQLRATGLFAEHYRPKQVDMLAATHIFLDDGRFIGFAVHRDGVDFSERERTIMDLLRPHLAQAFANAQAFERLHRVAGTRRDGLVALGAATILIDRGGRILSVDPWVRDRLLANDPENAVERGRLPDAVDRWARAAIAAWAGSDGVAADHRPLVLEGRPRLVARIAPSGDGFAIIVQEAHRAVDRERLRAMGMSDREVEVLEQLATGATDRRIGQVLGISPRTVQKHLERMYDKLGVRTRTALALLASGEGRESPVRSGSDPT